MSCAARVWIPRVTVAAVVVRDGKYLLVEEETDAGAVFNQPAGHLDPGESLASAVVRETLEETAYAFRPLALLGVYQHRQPPSNVTYIRFAFTGEIVGHDPVRPLDKGIIRALWLSPEEIRSWVGRHRSPLVLRCVDDHLAGNRYPLDVLTYCG